MSTGQLVTTTASTTIGTSAASSSSSGGSSGTTSGVSNTPSTSPTAFLPPRPEKRKSKDESPSPVNGNGSGGGLLDGGETKSLINPLTGLNVQIPAKKVKTAIPCPISPVLLECPEQDCSKKYKHANGLKYHQSHAHGLMLDEDSLQPPESPGRQPSSTTPSPAPQPTPATTPQPPALAEPQSPASTAAAPIIPSSSIPAALQAAQTAMLATTTNIDLSVQPPAPVIAEEPLILQTATTLPAETSPLQTQQAIPTIQTPQQQHPVVAAGGSITTGIAGSVMQQQQQVLLNPSSMGDPSSLSPIPTSQLQHSAASPLVNASGSIVQTPTRPDVQGKSTFAIQMCVVIFK